jgi:chromosome segregation ATPase
MSERKEYIDKMAEQLKSWDNELIKYQEKIKNVNDNMRQNYQEELSRIKDKMSQVQNKLNEMRQAGDGAWKELRAGLERSWTELRNSFESARSKF